MGILKMTDRRLTNTNLSRHFKYLWKRRSLKKIYISRELQSLDTHNIKSVNPQEIFTPAFHVPRIEDFEIPQEAPPPLAPEPLYVVGTSFSPLLARGLDLAQQLCWSVVANALPGRVAARRREVADEEAALVQQSILSCHLFDAWHVELPKHLNYELPNKIEEVKTYGIPPHRKNELLSERLLEVLSQTSLDPLQLLTRPVLHHTTLTCAVRHTGSLVLLQLPCPLWVGAYSPLPPVAALEETQLFVPKPVDEKTKRKILRKQMVAETGGPLQYPLPPTDPFLPFIGAKKQDQYELPDTRYVMAAPHVFPHTAHIHHVAPLLPLPALDDEQRTAQTLVNLYAHALSFALTSRAQINSAGHLERPVVVQGIHWDQHQVQTAVFQLNTIGPHCRPCGAPHLSHLSDADAKAGAGVRNAFFFEPFQSLYSKCGRDETGQPMLIGVNREAVASIRALCEAQ